MKVRAADSYSLTLTWNEGIASRGKFRGKATPVGQVSAIQERKEPVEAESTIQFECYDPNQVPRKRKAELKPKAPTLTFQDPVAEETQTSPSSTTLYITDNPEGTYNASEWVMSDDATSLFQPLVAAIIDCVLTHKVTLRSFSLLISPRENLFGCSVG